MCTIRARTRKLYYPFILLKYFYTCICTCMKEARILFYPGYTYRVLMYTWHYILQKETEGPGRGSTRENQETERVEARLGCKCNNLHKSFHKSVGEKWIGKSLIHVNLKKCPSQLKRYLVTIFPLLFFYYTCILQSKREVRVDSWRSFQQKGKKKKKMSGALKPPKLKQEKRL